MTLNAEVNRLEPETFSGYKSILLAVDSSDHANRGISESTTIARLFNAKITATHVYAAKMHDLRFRQMEGGLPEQFRVEEELERQRDVHDDLITRGLSIITDSYLDQAEKHNQENNVRFQRRSLEGKNYRALVNETNSGEYDLLVIGALGLGAVKGSRLGTVCSRVSRRSDIDTLVIKDPRSSITDGPIVVAIDGSSRAYGGLLTALTLACDLNLEVKVISAFDPYYHYVAFNRIAGVLSEAAGKVFKFKDQEKLHEEIIDSGLAKIYQGHLAVAESVAEDYHMKIETELLDGKPHDAIERYLQRVKPSLLVIGKLGIHADPDLDIGGNAENLLGNVSCNVLLSQREYQPRLEMLADVTTSWSREAEDSMERVPDFVRNMARMAILRYAQEQGHTVITASIVEEATAQLMPQHAHEAMEEIVDAYESTEVKQQTSDTGLCWNSEAEDLLANIEDESVRHNLKMRAEKKAHSTSSSIVKTEHVAVFIDQETIAEPHWQATALARLMQAPEGFMRDMSRKRIEEYARSQDVTEITLAVAERGLAAARSAMQEAMGETADNSSKTGKCPFTNFSAGGQREDTQTIPWSSAARTQLQNIPEGYCQDMTVSAINGIASRAGVKQISPEFVDQILKTFSFGSQQVTEKFVWDEEARQAIARAPDMIRGMLIREIESWAQNKQLDKVDLQSVQAVKDEWRSRGVFHLHADDPRNT